MSVSDTSGTTGAYIRVSPSFGTSTSIAISASVVVAEAEFIIREARMNYLRTVALPEIGDDYSDEEELEWNAFFAQPDVQAELERLAEEAERQFAAGETEEGGFAVE
jgi:hypothetical protein